jgi:hypothetical protein
MSSAQENRAIRDYLDLLKDWVYNAWINGVEFDEIHQSLVHYRDPWIRSVTDSQVHPAEPSDKILKRKHTSIGAETVENESATSTLALRSTAKKS